MICDSGSSWTSSIVFFKDFQNLHFDKSNRGDMPQENVSAAMMSSIKIKRLQYTGKIRTIKIRERSRTVCKGPLIYIHIFYILLHLMGLQTTLVTTIGL